MQYEIRLPQLELTMENATVVNLLVKEGDRVALDQGIVEVETQKANSEVTSTAAGFVRQVCVQVGDIIPGNAVLCVLTDTVDETWVEHSATGGAPEAAKTAAVAAAVEETAPGEIRAAPAARKLAKDLGVELSNVRGTGPGGRIMVADVQAVASSPKEASDAGGKWQDLPPSRIALNAQMQRSLAEIPQIVITRQLDVSALSVKSEGLTFTHRFIAQVARALAAHPALRTSIKGTQVRIEPVSVAVAMSTAHGLVAPVLRAADELSLGQIAAAMGDFRERGEKNTLRGEELRNGPFALTNLGMLEVDFFTPFVFYGQTAVLAIGRAVDMGAGRKAAWCSLAVDHRVVDGAEAARFLKTLQEQILTLEGSHA